MRHNLIRLLCCLLCWGVFMPTTEARRKKAPKQNAAPITENRTETRQQTSKETHDGWLTSQGAGTSHSLKGTLSAPLLLDSGLVQATAAPDDGIYGLTQQGTVFKAKASGNSPSTQWRVASVVTRPDSLALQGDVLWVTGSKKMVGINTQSGAVEQTAMLPMPARAFTLDATTLLLALDNGHLLAWRNQQVVWDADLKSPMVGQPLVSPQGIYVADLQGVARKLDPKTGQSLWEFGLGGPYTASPVLTPDAQLLMLPCQIGTVFGLNPDNGQRLMSHTLPEGTPFLASGAAHNKNLVAVDEDGLAFALERQNNRRLWQQRLRGRVSHALIVAGSNALVTLEDGRLAALSLTTGKVDWTAQIPGIIATTPVMTRQHVWLGTIDGRLFWVN